jgi:pyruvate/2-oxoglutarate/acetoin dehydrogenase E1 component
MYNTLLRSDDPAIVVECLNGYRLKERLPDNIAEFTVPLGVPDVLRVGADVTMITYGSSVRVAEEACDLLALHGISVELIDVQTLLPFDLPEVCLKSLQKTNRVVFLDEDFAGGGTGYLMQQVLDRQGGYRYLDSAPLALAAKAHRPAYGQDGDYFSKPQVEDIFEAIYGLMREVEPGRWGI